VREATARGTAPADVVDIELRIVAGVLVDGFNISLAQRRA